MPFARWPGDPDAAPISNLSVYPGAVCLDGTPGAYYHLKGTGSGANKWYIHHQGGTLIRRNVWWLGSHFARFNALFAGGWCESMDDCLGRSKSTSHAINFWVYHASLTLIQTITMNYQLRWARRSRIQPARTSVVATFRRTRRIP